jgi:hypothetical protein
MKRDQTPSLTPLSAIAPDVYAADTTPAALDLVDCGSATILIHVGIGGITFSTSNKVEFKLTHSDDNSTYAAVADDDVVLSTNADASVGSGGIIKSLIAAHAAADITKVGYVGGKRYLKLLADFSGTHGTGTGIAATVIKGRLHLEGQS